MQNEQIRTGAAVREYRSVRNYFKVVHIQFLIILNPTLRWGASTNKPHIGIFMLIECLKISIRSNS